MPIPPPQVFDFASAICDALAVYYVPGMRNCNREMVLPLAMESFFLSVQKQRDLYERQPRRSKVAERSSLQARP